MSFSPSFWFFSLTNSKFNNSSKYLIFSLSNQAKNSLLLDRFSHWNQYPIFSSRQGKMSTSPAQIEYIKRSELAQVIKDTTQVPGKDYLVVDVRDDDYEVSKKNIYCIY